jgi:hypothetical protein
MQSKGYRASTYVSDDSIWVFYCKPDAGNCKYYMWLRRAEYHHVPVD